MKISKRRWCASGIAAAALVVCAVAWAQQAQPQQVPGTTQDPGPSVTVDGRTVSQRQLFDRNMGSYTDQSTAFTPHKIIGNLYYVGTQSLASFLVVTAQGDILINSGYERDVPQVRKSIEQLKFKYSDVKIVLGSDARPEQMEGDALVKQQTGAQVMAMAEDAAALQNIRPGGKAHPVDRMLHDGDQIALGGTILVAHLTPGRTEGTTAWTMSAVDGGKLHNVAIFGPLGVDPGTLLVNNAVDPQIAQEYTRGLEAARALPCDVPLGAFAAMYDMRGKFEKLTASGANPFVDAAGCKSELDLDAAMFRAVLERQQAAAGRGGGVTALGGAPPAAAAPAAVPSASGSPAGAAAGGNAALVARGKDRYHAYACFDCHGQNGEGTEDAPDLVGTHLNADQIAAFLQKPSADALAKGMPNVPASSPDLPALVAFVLSMKKNP